MVLLASSRSLARSLGPLASRSRAFQSSAASRSLSTATARGQAKSTTLLRPAAATRTSSLLSTGSSFRMLTTQREKVKVLLVLYDGGQHAKDVSVNFPIGLPLSGFFFFIFIFFIILYPAKKKHDSRALDSASCRLPHTPPQSSPKTPMSVCSALAPSPDRRVPVLQRL